MDMIRKYWWVGIPFVLIGGAILYFGLGASDQMKAKMQTVRDGKDKKESLQFPEIEPDEVGS